MDLVALKVKSWDEMPVSHEYICAFLITIVCPLLDRLASGCPIQTFTFPFLVDKESLQPQAWI